MLPTRRSPAHTRALMDAHAEHRVRRVPRPPRPQLDTNEATLDKTSSAARASRDNFDSLIVHTAPQHVASHVLSQKPRAHRAAALEPHPRPHTPTRPSTRAHAHTPSYFHWRLCRTNRCACCYACTPHTHTRDTRSERRSSPSPAAQHDTIEETLAKTSPGR